MTNATHVLGLDIGDSHVGWAGLNLDEERIVGLGAHMFPVPQDDKSKVTLMSKRRNHRSSRRNNQRSSNRRQQCIKILKLAGVMPSDVDASWLQKTSEDKYVLQLRADGLRRRLADREFAQVLFNLCKRRGYISHRKKDKKKEDGKVLAAIKDNDEKMAEGQFETVGEMFAAAGLSRNHGDSYVNCVRHEDVVYEIHKLFERQRELGNNVATLALEDAIIACINWEKGEGDTSGTDELIYKQVGKCSVFPDERRGAKSCLSFEMCSAYERFNNVRTITLDGRKEPLPPEVIKKSIDILFSPVPIKGNKDCCVRYSDLRKWLDLPTWTTFVYMSGDDEKKKEVYEPRIWRTLREVLPESLITRMREDIVLADDICSALTYATSDASLIRQLESIDLSQEDIDALLEVPFNGVKFTGYGSRSSKATQILVDSFSAVDSIHSLADAMAASGLKDAAAAPSAHRGLSLPPYASFDPTCKNSVVLRVMGRVRRVVNAYIREYGMPDEIHIELGRELKYTVREKKQIAENNRGNSKIHQAAVASVVEVLGCEPDNIPIELLRVAELWHMQDGIDFYTGNPIDFERAMTEEHYCEIDHVYPYSRSCDDSRNNKVLTFCSENYAKGIRTPYEWLSETGGWEEFQKRVLSNEKTKGKLRMHLLNTSFAENQDRIISRHLNDTRYACRKARDYIESNLSLTSNGQKQQVFVVAASGVTALRRAWGLTRKNLPDNDTRYAVDAAIIASCSTSLVMKVAKAAEQKEFVPKTLRKDLFDKTQPWAGFKRELMEAIEAIIPTRMLDFAVNRSLFEESVYAFVGMREEGTRGFLRKPASLSRQVTSSFATTDQQSNPTAWHTSTFGGMKLLKSSLSSRFSIPTSQALTPVHTSPVFLRAGKSAASGTSYRQAPATTVCVCVRGCHSKSTESLFALIHITSLLAALILGISGP